MPLKRHHKIIIGGFSTVVLVYMIVAEILLNGTIVKQELNQIFQKQYGTNLI